LRGCGNGGYSDASRAKPNRDPADGNGLVTYSYGSSNKHPGPSSDYNCANGNHGPAFAYFFTRPNSFTAS
jgi:hypothetical protein